MSLSGQLVCTHELLKLPLGHMFQDVLESGRSGNVSVLNFSIDSYSINIKFMVWPVRPSRVYNWGLHTRRGGWSEGWCQRHRAVSHPKRAAGGCPQSSGSSWTWCTLQQTIIFYFLGSSLFSPFIVFTVTVSSGLLSVSYFIVCIHEWFMRLLYCFYSNWTKDKGD